MPRLKRLKSNMNSKRLSYFIIGTFVSLYAIVSIISTIHVIDFFSLSNPTWLAVSLAIAFEIGAAASLASLIALKKMNKSLIWSLFITLTGMQMMGNTYYAYTNLQDFQSWVELFGLVDAEPIVQKRILSIVSGAILPLVALGFIKSLVDYIRPSEEPAAETVAETTDDIEEDKLWETASLTDAEQFFEEEAQTPIEQHELEPVIQHNAKESVVEESPEDGAADSIDSISNPQVLPGVNT